MRPLRRRADRLLLGLLLLGVLAWGILSVAPRARFDPRHPELHMTDFTTFTAASTALLAGNDPYTAISPRGWPYLYPPFFALVLAPLRNLPTHLQALCWFVINLGLACGCVYEARRVGLIIWQRTPAAQAAQPPGWLGIVAFAAAVLPMLDCLQAGQTGHAVLYPLLAGLRQLLAADTWRRDLLAGLLLALPIAIKATPALPVLLLLGTQLLLGNRRRALQVVAGLTAASGVCWIMLPAAVVGWQTNNHLLSRRLEQVSRAADVTAPAGTGVNLLSPRNQSLYVACYRLTHGWPVRHPPSSHESVPGTVRAGREHQTAINWRKLAVVCFAGVLAALAATAVRLARSSEEPAASSAILALGCAASLLISPISWGHHFVFLLPVGLLVCGLLYLRHRCRLALALSLALPVLTVLHYAALDVAGRYGVLALGFAFWFIAACAFIHLPASPPAGTGARHVEAKPGTT